MEVIHYYILTTQGSNAPVCKGGVNELDDMDGALEGIT